jgi:hypothetical protein
VCQAPSSDSMQDIFCNMTALQQHLYDTTDAALASGELPGGVVSSKVAASNSPGKGNLSFETLNFLRKVCSHPYLVLDWSLPSHSRALRAVLPAEQCKDGPSAMAALLNIHHSPKLIALRQLLADCGIIQSDLEGDGAATAEKEATHRVLVFAQLKGTLDLVEETVLQAEGVAYVRLDGDVPVARRHALVTHFNSDPTVHVMLLTTAVGSLGLNLTSADTVVFLEHDWNPMKDLQVLPICVSRADGASTCCCGRAWPCICRRNVHACLGSRHRQPFSAIRCKHAADVIRLFQQTGEVACHSWVALRDWCMRMIAACMHSAGSSVWTWQPWKAARHLRHVLHLGLAQWYTSAS